MIILVSGILKYDSGKTTWTLELIGAFKNIGMRPIPYKPMGAHSAWFQYYTLANSIRLGKLVGEDAYRLALSANMLDEIEIISPVDILSAPLDPERYVGTGIKRYVEDLSFLDAQAVLARITTMLTLEGRFTTTHYLIIDNYERIIRSLVDDINEFVRKVSNIHRITRNELLSMLSNPRLHENLAMIQDYLVRRSNLLIIESYNDAAIPTFSALNANYVTIVAPGKVFVYNGRDYAKAFAVYSSIKDPLSIDVPTIMSLLKKPIMVLNWRPLIVEKEYEPSPSPSAEKVVEFLSRESKVSST